MVTMKNHKKAIDRIKLAILKIPKGKLFSLSDFRQLATQNNIKQVFHRLAKDNEIQRVSRGVYMREKIVFQDDGYKPASKEILTKLTNLTGEVIFYHGDDSLRYLQLSTQVSMKEMYFTSGNSRDINVGERHIKLIHFNSNVVRSNILVVQHVFSGLAYLGKNRVNLDTIMHIKEVLGEKSFQLLFNHLGDVPSWLSNILYVAMRDGND